MIHFVNLSDFCHMLCTVRFLPVPHTVRLGLIEEKQTAFFVPVQKILTVHCTKYEYSYIPYVPFYHVYTEYFCSVRIFYYRIASIKW